MAFDYDLFVIGGGSGGVRAARLAASQGGARTAIAEMSRYGGTCVIRGCVPKKLMVFASSYREAFAEAEAFGWDVTPGAFNWQAFRAKLEPELNRLESVYRNTLANSGVETYDARARLVDPHTVELSTGERITSKHILLAIGGRPVRPNMENADLGIVSDEIFNLPELPKKVLIIGGGFIACEFACILNGMGCDVTQFYRGAQILRGFDDQARAHLSEIMCQNGINLLLGTSILEMRREGRGVWVKSTSGKIDTYDQVLFATGRRPNTSNVGLEEVGVAVGRRGEILVDKFSQTSVPSIYAVGDVTNRINLTPVAIREGAAFVETVFKSNPTAVDHELVPSAVFTQPEFGTIGLTEEEARDQEAVHIYVASFRAMRPAFAGRDDRVLMKLIVSQATDKVLGCHIVAENAGEMIQLAGVAIKMGATKADFDRTVAVHPTMAEELVTMKTPVRSA